MTTTSDATTPAPSLTGNYSLDPAHSRIGFSARHAMVSKVRGAFNEVEGTGYFDEADPSKSHLELKIKVASIDTRNADRDQHLRTNDFLAADQYPEITFRSTSITKTASTTYRVVGDLAIRGVTKPVELDFEFNGTAVDPWGNTRVGFEGGTTINRKDWGINWNTALDAGGVMVGDKVNLEIEIEAIKAKD